MADDTPTLREYVALGLTAQSKATDAAFAAHVEVHRLESVALNKAEERLDTKLAEMNELRAQINTERGQFVTRAVLDAEVKALVAEIRILRESRASFSGGMLAVTALVGLVGAVVGILAAAGLGK